jgi:hypothetical protein
MRMLPSRYMLPQPAKVKGNVSQVAHVSAPLKGLSLSSQLTVGDPLTAPILINLNVENDRLSLRAGYRKLSNAGAPVVSMVPFYGVPQKLAVATQTEMRLASTGALIKSGFTGGDWSWTAFANLGTSEYTVMVNGFDGVWSWNGSDTASDPPAVPGTIGVGTEARITVAHADIGKFVNGQFVVVAGATGLFAVANGSKLIKQVGIPADTITLVGVDTSTATGTQAVTVDPPGLGLAKEIVTAPASATWIIPNQFNIVINHMNRLWFADSSNLAIYYLPIQQKAGEVKPIPLNAVFKRGGSIRAMATWTLDGGAGTDDLLVIFSSNGEAVIYGGVDPDTDIGLRGIYRFDAPMSKHCTINYGGELYVLISTGLVPMSTLMQAESEQLGQADKNVVSLFRSESVKYRDRPGWQVFINPSSNRVFCNIPQGASNNYTQMIRHMPLPVWSQYKALPSRCWGWIDPYVYFADDDGNVYQMHPDFLNDDGKPIRVDVQVAWSLFKTPALKHFKMLRTFIICDTQPQIAVDMKCDYDLTPPQNEPNAVTLVEGSLWNVSDWDVTDWAPGVLPDTLWNGIGRLGRVGAVRLTANVLNSEFSITGWDVIFEVGGAV